MLNVYWQVILSALFLALAACGPQLKSVKPDRPEGLGANGHLVTGATSQTGAAYTGFGPEADTIQAKELTENTDDNKKFASQIISIKSALQEGGNLSLEVKWQGLEKPLIFIGPLSSLSNITDSTGQMPNLRLNAICEANDCDVLKAFLEDNQSHKVSFTIRKEQRTLTIKIPEAQKENIKKLEPTQKRELEKDLAQAKNEVTVTSTEIFPGRATFEITATQSTEVKSSSPVITPAKTDQAKTHSPVVTGKLTGELVSTTDGGQAILAEGKFKDLGAASLVGNTNDGELIFRFTQDASQEKVTENSGNANNQNVNSKNKFDVVTYAVLEPRKALEQQGANNDQKVIHADPQAHPLVRQILADSTRPELQNFLTRQLSPQIVKTKSGNRPQGPTIFSGLAKMFVGCHLGDSKLCGVDSRGQQKKNSVKQISQILRSQGLPSALTMLSLIESTFEPNLTSSAGAAGWWQFMPATAQGMGLRIDGKNRIDERRNLEKSTLAAIKYIKYLLVSWNGDLKMALASYNYGENGTRRVCRQVVKTDTCVSGFEKGKRMEDIKDLLEISNNDFWKFHRSNFLPAETQNYVLKFLAGNIIALNPNAYGFELEPIDIN